RVGRVEGAPGTACSRAHPRAVDRARRGSGTGGSSQHARARKRGALQWLTRGYSTSPEEAVGPGIFEERHDSMVLVRSIELYSLCEHHMLPFYGRAHVAYVPNGRIIGLSKVARLVDVFARRLQVQERLTDQIADALEAVLRPRGVGVIV